MLRPEDVNLDLALPPRLQAAVLKRIRLLALFALLAYCVFLTLALTVLEPGSGIPLVRFRIILLSVSVVLSLAVFLTVPRLDPQRAVILALVMEGVACLFVAVPGAMVLDPAGVIPPVTWATPIIIMFPLLVPAPPRWTLIASVACTLTAPLGVVLAEVLGFRAFPDIVKAGALSLVSPSIATVIAYVGAVTVHDLGLRAERERIAGSYVLGKKLGEGGMGEVYMARHVRLPRPAAIKFIRPEQLEARYRNRDAALRRFEREAAALARLCSPHTVNLYDYDLDEQGRLYFAMELLDGWNSDELVQEFGPLPAARVVHVVAQACRSLEEAHRLGMIHRDIKPSNLMVCRLGLDYDFVKVMDFGILTTPEDNGNAEGSSGEVPLPGTDTARLTMGNLVMGTPDFMSPEQVRREPLDGRSDVYALGLVAYYLITGSYAFRGGDPQEKMRRQMNEPPEPPSSRREGIPPGVESVILAALAKDRDDRPASAAEFATLLVEAGGKPWSQADAAAWWQEHRR